MKQRIYPAGERLNNPAYSPGILVGELVFVSGQGPLNPETKEFEVHDFEREVELTLSNVERVLVSAGASLRDVVKVTVHLQNINDFMRMNTVYERYFPEPRPARTTVQSVLMSGISVEIDAIAVRGCGGLAEEATQS
jgi:2-iminobutanoate/2-iminopropanoate deaminase